MSSYLDFAVDAVMMNEHNGWPCILLRNQNRKKAFTISVNKAAAFSVFYALKPDIYNGNRRVFWVDLLVTIIHLTGCSIKMVLLDNLIPQTSENIFTAKLTLSCNKGQECITLDCAPSDAIPIAMRSYVPIRVSQEVFTNIPDVAYDCAPYRECSPEDFYDP